MSKAKKAIVDFYQRTGTWGLELLGAAVEETGGDMEAAMKLAERQFKLTPCAPASGKEKRLHEVISGKRHRRR